MTNELAEETLELAEKIWGSRIKVYGSSTAEEDEPLRLIMETEDRPASSELTSSALRAYSVHDGIIKMNSE